MKLAKLYIIFMLVMLIGLLSFNIGRDQILFAIAPSYAKNINFIKLTKGDQDLYLLGTIHGQHLSTKDYSLAHLQAVIENIKPDLLLVESKPEELAKDNLGDGPIEMPFSSLIARSLHIKVNGIDWWEKGQGSPGTSNNLREDKMVSKITESIGENKKVLVLSGYSHIPEFVSRLKKNGFSEDAFSSADKEKLFKIKDKEFIYPKGMSYYISKRIRMDEELLKHEKEQQWIFAIKKGIEFRKELLFSIRKTGEK